MRGHRSWQRARAQPCGQGRGGRAESYGDLLSTARAGRRATKATDLLIIATARATGRTLVTLDDAQASLARLAGVAVQT